MSLTASLAQMSATSRINSAQAAIISANQAQMDLLNSKGSLDSISRKETQLELEKIKAQTKAKAAKAEKDAIKNKKNKLDFTI